MKKIFHKATGIMALLLIASFFLTSAYSELVGDPSQIIAVKKFIVTGIIGMFLLMPILGITGLTLAGKSNHPIILKKKKRIRLIGMNGLLLTTLAFFLYHKAINFQFDTWFWIGQGLEFLLGGINITLMLMMIIDGRSLSKIT